MYELLDVFVRFWRICDSIYMHFMEERERKMMKNEFGKKEGFFGRVKGNGTICLSEEICSFLVCVSIFVDLPVHTIKRHLRSKSILLNLLKGEI